jgi:hypothetical protein
VTAHTPGPWRARSTAPQEVGVSEGWPIRIESAAAGHDGELVAQSYGDANARLIAAAPELLRALVDLVRETDGGAQPCGHQFHQQASDAIRKAEAGQ